MDAGSELDILVAEQVMGWTRDGEAFRDTEGALRTIDLTSFGQFQPSRDMNDAWAVVDAMGQRHGFESINGFLLTKRNPDDWYCEFPQPHWEDDEAETAPLAICRAALKAIGVFATV